MIDKTAGAKLKEKCHSRGKSILLSSRAIMSQNTTRVKGCHSKEFENKRVKRTRFFVSSFPARNESVLYLKGIRTMYHRVLE